MNLLTVREVLQTGCFKHAKVIAGETGLDNLMKWTHIIETNEFEGLLNGGELILTTGMNLELETSLETLKKFIDKKVSGICIEIGPYFQKLSPSLKQFADEHHFPVIVFERTVKFVDITQKVHSLIINKHYDMLHRLNRLNKIFTELSFQPNGILKILQALHQYFQKTALFIGSDVKNHYYPPEAKKLALHVRFEEIHSEKQNLAIEEKPFAVTPIHMIGQIWGYLCLETGEESQTELILSVLDGAAKSIAQILLRNRTMEERKMNEEDELVQNLLLGKPYNKDELKLVIPQAGQNLNYRVLLMKHATEASMNEDEWKELKVQRALSIRTVFKQHGFQPAVSVRKAKTAVILFFNNENVDDLDVLTQITPALADQKSASIGISAKHCNFSSFSKAYKEANEVIRSNEINRGKTLFYEKTGIYRLLFSLKDEAFLKQFASDHLGPLIAYDKKMKTELLKTLETYLAYQASKKETAARLHIVRQTLYHRLDKINELLGEAYLDSENRLALEVAIKVYRMVGSPLS